MAYSKLLPEQHAKPVLGLGPTVRADNGSRRVRVDTAGRIVVPAGIRKSLGIGAGQELLISLDDGFVKLQTIDAALERVRAIARRRRQSDASVVNEFIAERRAEAAGE